MQVNSAFELMVGLKAQDVIGKTAREVFPADESMWLEIPQKVLESGKTQHIELYSAPINKYLDLYYFPYGKDKVGTLFRDITERKNMEKQLQEKERSAVIGQTAGMVGHDIRNPLQAIVGELYIARENMAKQPDSEGKHDGIESINFIQEQVDYINKIVVDLQDYAKETKPLFSEISFQEVIAETFATIDVPNILLTIHVQPNTKANTDPNYMRRIITNLSTNAIQAMPSGGELKVDLRKS